MGFWTSVYDSLKGNKVWNEVAHDLGAEFIDGGFWRTDKIIYTDGKWEIIMDKIQEGSGKNSQTFTRVQAAFVRQMDLEMKVYPEHILLYIGKLFGLQDIVIGNEKFDDKFVVKGNNEYKVSDLLSSNEIMELLLLYRYPYLEIKLKSGWFDQSYPKDVSVLHFKQGGKMSNRTEIFNVFLLFSLILKRLVQLDLASEEPAGINLA